MVEQLEAPDSSERVRNDVTKSVVGAQGAKVNLWKRLLVVVVDAWETERGLQESAENVVVGERGGSPGRGHGRWRRGSEIH